MMWLRSVVVGGVGVASAASMCVSFLVLVGAVAKLVPNACLIANMHSTACCRVSEPNWCLERR